MAKTLTTRQLKNIINEEIKDILSNKKPEDVKAIEDAWYCGNNLSNRRDWSKEITGKKTESGIEILKITESRKMSRHQTRRLVESEYRKILRRL